jgi:hypothetical protein
MNNVTGRDGYIIAQALAYAIAAIDSLPDDLQELSNQRDMKRLLKANLKPAEASMYLENGRRLFGKPI